MIRKFMLAGATAAAGAAMTLGPAMPPTAQADAGTIPSTGVPMLAPHENSYTGPEGFRFTVGHTDHAARPVAPLNAMPTNREVFLDNTSYGQVEGGGSGTLKAGYFVACAVDLEVQFSADASAGFDAGVSVGAGGSPDSLSPSVSASIGPSMSAGIGFGLSITPGKIVDVEVGEKALTPGGPGYLVSRDFHLLVQGCGGPLTIRAYTKITADSPAVTGNGAVFGDPIVL
ncbi:MspA family porin [Nocardia cyriacigeorgica]|uniref:MspA family porin n=1 Tax=Nocardia cyriacigeorgica TaxID=135487 RepID=A0A5R8NZH5_9NOCA|nr:MspA family porin [Nocardia cyriacigeorgica]TLF82340.1 MspA family porin [Nocardia cyriacigeorgica]